MAGKRQYKHSAKRDAEGLLHIICNHIHSLKPEFFVKGQKGFRPSRLHKRLDEITGLLLGVQSLLEKRTRIRPRKAKKKEMLDLLWWAKFHRRMRELKDAGIDPKSEEGSRQMADIQAAVFE